MAAPDRKTVKTLGEYSYAIPDVTKRTSPFQQTLMFTLALVLSPLLFPGLVMYTIFMFLGPMSLRDLVLSTVIPYAMKFLEDMTHNQRKLLLQHVSGRVLDVGAGGGAYLQHCKHASHYVAIDPVEGMHPLIANKAKLAGLQDYQLTICSCDFENYDAHTSSCFDWIILGNVLCEVQDVHATLHKVHHLLKPGGHIYFSEHLAAPLHSVTRKFQELINPWWRLVSGGCNCNRDSLHAIEGMECWDVVSWSLDGISVLGGPMVMGLARKVVSD
jgi:SAM-dependent methyltransferase